MQKPRLADVIAFALTDDIVSHRLEPGAALDEERLAKRFGASRTPVREALRELAAGGLVELRPECAVIDLRVTGEGVVIDAAQTPEPGHLGLASMRDRVILLGGTLTV